MPSILFVCTANQFRSPLAESLFKRQIANQAGARDWRVESAGTWAQEGLEPPAFTLEAARSLGLRGLRGHRTRQISPALLDGFDLVVVMESGQKEAICAEFPSVCRRVYLLAGVVDDLPYDIPDPTARGVDPAAVASILNDLVTRGAERLARLAEVHSRE